MKKTKLTRSLMAAVSIVALSAVMYGCVHSGDDAPQMEAPDLSMQVDDASAAAMAAADAASDAADAVAAVTAIRSLDAVAYLQAQTAVAAAATAAAEAAQASDAADDAMTVEEADAAQADAEAARDRALTALANARLYAGTIQAIKDANDATASAAAEAAALSDAQMAASDAADAAKEAAGDAQAELDGQTANADADAASYAALQMAVQAANDAYMAAMAASASAAASATSAEAAGYQATAEAQRDAAQTALTNAQMHAGMVAAAKVEADRLADEEAAEAEAMALAAAQGAASTAADAAKVASDMAAAAVAGVSEDARGADAISYAQAQDKADEAMDAYMAAKTASDAAAAAADSAAAEAQQVIAETKQGEAEAAQADAVRLAGVVTMTHNDNVESAALMAAQSAASDAADAAKTAADKAAAVVDDQLVNSGADQDSFDRASAAAAGAEIAYRNAKSASDSAAMAGNSADAEMYRDQAVEQQGLAQEAYMIAKMYAGMVMTAHTDLGTAQTGAGEALGQARAAKDSAQEAVNDVERGKDLNASTMSAFALAETAAGAANEAFLRALAAEAAARTATTPADAEMYQEDVEDARDDAVRAQAQAVAYAGIVEAAIVVADMAEAEALEMARSMAMEEAELAHQAYMAADAAADEAERVLGAQHPIAMQARTEAVAAKNASQNAAEAYEAALNAETSVEAMGYHETATMQRMEAVEQQGHAVMSRILAESTALSDAQAAAMMASDDARDAATAAKKAADDAEALLGATHPLVVKARRQANDAEMAAVAAKDASDDATASTTSDDAKGHQKTAEDRQGDAEGSRMNAVHYHDEAVLVHAHNTATGKTTLIAAAQEKTSEAAGEAAELIETIREAAKVASDQADDAEEARDEAEAARTGYEAAKTAAMMARDAAEAVAALLLMAEAEATKAAAANTAAQDAEEPSDAEAAQGNAEAARDALMALLNGDPAGATPDAMMGVSGLASEATTQATNAETARSEHVIGLLMAANAVDVEDDAATTDVDEQAVEVMAVAEAIAEAASGSVIGITSRNTTLDTAVTASATWNSNTPANPDTDTDEVVMPLTVTITGVGDNPIVSGVNGGFDANDDGDVDDEGDTPYDDESIPGLPGFPYGFDITVAGTDDAVRDDRHVLVFTDKKQATALVPEVTTTVANLPVHLGRIKERSPGDGDDTPFLVTGALADLGGQVLYDHDGNPDTMAIAGSFACQGEAATCVLQVTDGKLVAIEGDVRFSTTVAQMIMAEVPADPMNDYLVFGVWLDETDGDDVAEGRQPDFGAFAHGGNRVISTIDVLDPITGTATYEGSAAGVKATASAVDYFTADATLTARFGAIDTDAEMDTDPPEDTTAGTVTGMIHNIVAGGESVADAIYLHQSDIGSATDGAALSGSTRMGDDTVVLVPGEIGYAFRGVWSGAFYNPATTNGDADFTKAPGSIAGTFGVRMSDDPDTMDVNEETSFVGAFGAHKED